MRDAFAALRVPHWIKPGIGGLALGLLALRLPQVLGGGYGWIQEAIDGQLRCVYSSFWSSRKWWRCRSLFLPAGRAGSLRRACSWARCWAALSRQSSIIPRRDGDRGDGSCLQARRECRLRRC